MRNFLKIVIVVWLMVELTGCFMAHRDSYSDDQNRENISILIRELSENNVRVYQSSNSIALVLPDKDFFVGNSANFTTHAYHALDLVYSLSHYHKGTTMAVTGYSSSSDYDQFGKALATERAHRVAQYLLRAKIHANFVYAEGKNRVLNYQKNLLNDCVLVEFIDFY